MNMGLRMGDAPLLEMTWAEAQPLVGVMRGREIRLKDAFFTSNAFAYSDGTNWLQKGLWESNGVGPALPCPGNTSENTVKSLVLPGGLLGGRGQLIPFFRLSSTASANAKTCRIRVGGQVICPAVLTNHQSANLAGLFEATGTQNAQRCFPNCTFTSLTVPFNYLTLDMTVDQIIAITLQLALSTEAFAVESWSFVVKRAI